MSECGLPESWGWATASNVCSVIQDGTHFSPEVQYDSAGPGRDLYLTSKNIRPYGVDLTGVTWVASEVMADLNQRCEPALGDVLIVKDGVNTGTTAVNSLREPFCFLSSVALLRPVADLLDNRYLCHYLASPEGFGAVTGQMSGSAIQRIILRKLRDLRLPIAPLNEQRRIADKLDELLSQLDAGVAALERVRANLKRYRAAVLKAAVEGKLTAQWRAEQTEVEPAAVLLERILADRRRQWEAEQLAKYEAQGKRPPKGWQAKYQQPRPPDTTGLPELPEGWCWAKVEDVGDLRLGRQRSPQNHQGPHMRPYLRVANVFEDRIDASDVMQMNFTPAEFETFGLADGDLLLNEGQSPEFIGRPAIYRGEVPGCCFTNTLIRFRARPAVDVQFALAVFRHYMHCGRFKREAKITTNIAHLSVGRLAPMEFPVPPPAEQVAILAELDALLMQIEHTDHDVAMSLQRATRLRQSILKQAFEGKLVPQDPNDEPAEVLLERIAAERGLARRRRRS